MAIQRAQGEFLAFLGAEMRPLLGDVPKGVRTARSVSGHTIATHGCTIMTHPDTALSYWRTVMTLRPDTASS
jgi:hypothetical protein